VIKLITGIIMASGFSRRMEGEKLLLPIHGEPIIERVIKVLKNSEVDEIILIYQNSKIKEIGTKYGVRTIYNHLANQGQSVAMKLGINSSSSQSEGFVFCVGDQPFLDSQTVNKLIANFNEDKGSIVVPLYNGNRGNPVIFPARLRSDLLNIQGDRGGRVIIERNLERVKFTNIDNSKVGIDIDTWEEYERIRQVEMKR